MTSARANKLRLGSATAKIAHSELTIMPSQLKGLSGDRYIVRRPSSARCRPVTLSFNLLSIHREDKTAVKVESMVYCCLVDVCWHLVRRSDVYEVLVGG